MNIVLPGIGEISIEELTKLENIDCVICQICGEAFKRITNEHLKKHHMIIKEYKEKYPNAKIDTKTGKTYEEIHGEEKAKELRKQLSKYMSDCEKNPNRDRIGKNWEEIFGEKKAKELKKVQGKLRLGKTLEEIHGIEKGKKLRENMSGENHPGYGKTWDERYGKEKAKELRKILSVSMTEHNKTLSYEERLARNVKGRKAANEIHSWTYQNFIVFSHEEEQLIDLLLNNFFAENIEMQWNMFDVLLHNKVVWEHHPLRTWEGETSITKYYLKRRLKLNKINNFPLIVTQSVNEFDEALSYIQNNLDKDTFPDRIFGEI